MNFTYPAFLLALSAVAIPIIIHLFNFRKFKTVYFSSIRFLKEVKEETQAKSKVKHLLVLITRILAIVSLVLAFAQPYIPAENKKIVVGDKTISIFIDNSFSMNAENKNGTLLNEAKKRALEIVASYNQTDRFQLLTNDFEGRHQRLVNPEEFAQLVEEIKISPVTKTLSEIISRQSDLISKANTKVKSSYILSDFQKNFIDKATLKNYPNLEINLLPLSGEEKNNLYIDSCWFETPVRQLNVVEKLHVVIKNNSVKEIENNSIKLFVNNVQKTPASFNVSKQSETEIILSFVSKQTGVQHCRIEINDYPITFDDKFYFSFEVSKNILVLCINGPGISAQSPYLTKLFGNDSLFVLKNSEENKLDFSSLSQNNLIVLNELKTISSGLSQELYRFMDAGGSVIAFPNKQSDLSSYNEFFGVTKSNTFEKFDTAKTKVDKLNLDHQIYKDVFDKKTFSATNLDLPIVFGHYVFSKNTKTNEEYLMKLQNGDNFLSRYEVGKGNVYVVASPLNAESSSFAKHSVFVPTLYKIAMYSKSITNLFFTIGINQSFETNRNITGESVFHIISTDKKTDIIPEHSIQNSHTIIKLNNQITDAGNYNIYADKDLVTGISFNYNRKESDLKCYSYDELTELILKLNLTNYNIIQPGLKNITKSISETAQGKKLWKLCIILALIFLAIEVLLLRLMKG